jgi:hypothetical protein
VRHASFLEKDAILFNSFGDTPCLEKNDPCESGRPNGAAGRKTQEQRKTKKTLEKQKKKISRDSCLDLPPPPKSLDILFLFFCPTFAFFVFFSWFF